MSQKPDGGIINDETIDLAGSSFGIITPKSRLVIGGKLQTGDVIIAEISRIFEGRSRFSQEGHG